jgi:streptogramin lyase
VRLADRLTVRISEVSQDLPSVVALGDLWVGDEVASEIVRVDGATGHVLARVPFTAADPDDPAFSLIAGPGSVWVVDGGVARVDPLTNTVTRIVPAGSGLSAVAF